ncbi:MarR family winged helix-turn-helix transcriptional regulator [Nocardia huaxiensis]|uniref:MarR family transcriptional regulator n=1 Tax=Nocardia huaxiensis TaxID=2755382 RepID=A0A7D6VMQ2_9NOCA|nr:MarR family transcriptional regulator [Nocardia huaxiensis]QLY33336.1 MarR family transcriptional regulator [Nocardia huaxiensis]UFS99755.1 MarR family transcriptional regulator [Nocardia huaxiensis]
MSETPTPDEVWRLLTHVVIDSRDPWRRAVTERTGMPFSRIRVLKRLRPGPITLKELAHAAGMDAPAATVAVNDLEERGLVVREIDPANRRQKLVSITEAGERVVADALDTPEPAPAPITELSDAELRALRDLLRKLEP